MVDILVNGDAGNVNDAGDALLVGPSVYASNA